MPYITPFFCYISIDIYTTTLELFLAFPKVYYDIDVFNFEEQSLRS